MTGAMQVITVSNLFPRPDQATRGVFNLQLFREMAAEIGIQNSESRIQKPEDGGQESGNRLLNICLVPEWRMWRWPAIRKWSMPGQESDHRPQTVDHRFQIPERRKLPVVNAVSAGSAGKMPLGTAATTEEGSGLSAVYLPVFYLPGLGRSINWWFYYRALRKTVVPDACTFLASWLYPDAVAVTRFARVLHGRVWIRVHGTDRYHLKNRWRRRLILEAVAHAGGVICNCQAVADELTGWGVPSGKIHIVPNGVDTALFRYRSKEEAWEGLATVEGGSLSPGSEETRQDAAAEGITNPESRSRKPEARSRNAECSMQNGRDLETRRLKDRIGTSKIVLFVGNLVPIKGPDIMIRAFAMLISDPPGAGLGRNDSVLVHGTPHLDPLPQGERKVPAEGLLGQQMVPLPSSNDDAGFPLPSGERARARVLATESFRLRSHSSFLIVIGSGPMRKRLERLARDLGVADRVHFVGSRPHSEIALWMNVADCLCLASHSEGMPNVVLEALASGLPVVATDAGACPELLAEEPASRICPAGQPETMAGCLRDMWRVPTDRQALSLRHGNRLSWPQTARMMLGLMATS